MGYLEAHVRALRRLLSGEMVHSDGIITLRGVALEPRVLPAHVPDLLLGVRGPRSLAASGRIADGTILAEPVTPEYVRAALAHIGGDGPHRLVAYNIAAVDDDEGAALRRARRGLSWIGEPDWAPHIAPLDFAAEFVALRSRCADGEQFAERMPEEWVARLALAGAPATVQARIRDLAAAGVTSSVMIPVGGGSIDELDELARAIAR